MELGLLNFPLRELVKDSVVIVALRTISGQVHEFRALFLPSVLTRMRERDTGTVYTKQYTPAKQSVIQIRVGIWITDLYAASRGFLCGIAWCCRPSLHTSTTLWGRVAPAFPGCKLS